MATVTILHTNDLHSELDQWPAAAALLKVKRKAAEERGEHVLLYDIGDHCDRVHPLTEGLMGRGNTELLNEMRYDAVTIGNNEGITLPKAALESLYERAEFDVLVANLYHPDGNRPSWCKPWELYILPDGYRLAVVGLTIPFYQFYEELGWKVEDPLQEMGELLPEMSRHADGIICLSHLGLRLDRELAEAFPAISVILGAHTHHVLENGELHHQTWIHQCGRSASHIGEITIETESGSPARVKHIHTHEVKGIRGDGETGRHLERLEAEALPQLYHPVAELPEALHVSWYEPSSLTALAAEGLREWCSADAAMFNAGLLLNSLPAGQVTRHHLHQICPHPINPAVVKIEGTDLKKIIRLSNEETMIHYRLRGYGFRGKVLGMTSFYGREGLINGDAERLIEDRRIYSLAVPDLFTFSHLYPLMNDLHSKQYFMPEFLRDVLAWKLEKTYGKASPVTK
ncbi:bifunctional metallophosphatase/5'-nucleotidase [Bacillus daqingensis]|uniref:Bifunctional metallophosphatase/5'-nucleotidase n=1 Tax=Bacillus daqingensis TaxID=872396 RepID=A0ABV9NUL2_9BACI